MRMCRRRPNTGPIMKRVESTGCDFVSRLDYMSDTSSRPLIISTCMYCRSKTTPQEQTHVDFQPFQIWHKQRRKRKYSWKANPSLVKVCIWAGRLATFLKPPRRRLTIRKRGLCMNLWLWRAFVNYTRSRFQKVIDYILFLIVVSKYYFTSCYSAILEREKPSKVYIDFTRVKALFFSKCQTKWASPFLTIYSCRGAKSWHAIFPAL